MARRLSAQDRFFAKVDKTGDCWQWTAKKTQNGYGQFWLEGGHQVAHRVSFGWSVGAVPPGMQLDHVCHDRSCVRPSHLRVVNHKQNQENQSGAYKNSRTGLRGVRRGRRGKGWRAEVTHHGTVHNWGPFATPEEAAEAARLKRLELFTHNDIDRVA